MKKLLIALLFISVSVSIGAQITIYEYKSEDAKSYCTFELDSELVLNSKAPVKGLFRAYEYLNVRYADIVFFATASVSDSGTVRIEVVPDFYHHANIAKLMGEREHMDCKECKLTFTLHNDVLTNTTSDDTKKSILFRSTYSQKKFIDITNFPSTMSKAKKIDWKIIPSNLRKTLQEKDKIFWRKY